MVPIERGHRQRRASQTAWTIIALAVAMLSVLAINPGTARAQDTCPQGFFFPDPEQATAFLECDAQGRLHRHVCPEGLGFNHFNGVCDWSTNLPTPTTTAAETAHLQLLPPRVVGLSARVTTTNGRPIPLHTVTFTAANGTPLCSAETNFGGRASCDSGALLGNVDALLQGYIARFTAPDNSVGDVPQSFFNSAGNGAVTLLEQ